MRRGRWGEVQDSPAVFGPCGLHCLAGMHNQSCASLPRHPRLQWFALTREHVELILRDTEVDGALRAHCRTMWEPERKDERECYSGGALHCSVAPGW